jgi:hypothetical protein
LALALDRSPHRPPAAYAEAAAWLAGHVAPGEGYAVDTRSPFQPAWLLPRGLVMREVSSTRNGEPLQPSELLPYFREISVRFVVVDYSSERRGAPRYFFFDRLPRHVPGGVKPVWSLPGSMQIFEVASTSEPAEATLMP